MRPLGIIRYARTMRLALLFSFQLWWLKRTRFLRGSRQEKAASALYTRQARQFVGFATKMGGLIVKLGQFMSVRIDLLPQEYIDELSKLQDALPALPTPQIVRVIEDELGKPLKKLYGSFDQAPLAAASLGQVYRATLPDGTPVAVKVLRPGIEDLVATDLRSLRAILRLMDRFLGISHLIDLDQLEADFKTTFSDELDYGKEAHQAETFQRNLLLNMHVDIPQIYWNWSSQRVLTMEFMDGVRIDDLEAIDAAGIDRHDLAVNLAGIFFHMVLNDGLFHADPHPGNVFVRRDGVIQLIDFGMIGTVTPEAREGYAELVLALAGHDATGLVKALKSLGFLGPGTDMKTMAAMLDPVISQIVGDVTRMYTRQSMINSMMTGQFDLTIDSDKLLEIQRFIYTQPIILPGQTTFLGKALITVIGLCLRLDPDLDLLAISVPYVTGSASGSTMDSAVNFVTKQLNEGVDLARNIIPTAKRLASVMERLDDGSFELELTQAVARRLGHEQRQQTKRIVRTIVGAAAAIVLVVGLRRR